MTSEPTIRPSGADINNLYAIMYYNIQYIIIVFYHGNLWSITSTMTYFTAQSSRVLVIH